MEIVVVALIIVGLVIEIQPGRKPVAGRRRRDRPAFEHVRAMSRWMTRCRIIVTGTTSHSSAQCSSTQRQRLPMQQRLAMTPAAFLQQLQVQVSSLENRLGDNPRHAMQARCSTR